jgi:hypothetical protein
MKQHLKCVMNLLLKQKVFVIERENKNKNILTGEIEVDVFD